jgi:hypothetical protein
MAKRNWEFKFVGKKPSMKQGKHEAKHKGLQLKTGNSEKLRKTKSQMLHVPMRRLGSVLIIRKRIKSKGGGGGSDGITALMCFVEIQLSQSALEHGNAMLPIPP